MRKFILLITTLCLTGYMFGQLSNLIIFSEQGERFHLVLNGIKQNGDLETNVKVTDLNANMYKAKIIFENQSIPQLDKNIYFNTLGNEYTYNIKQNKKGEYVLRYMSEVPIAQAPPASTGQTTIVYSTVPPPATNVTITETTTTSTTTSGNPEGVSMGVSINDPDMGVNFNMNVGTNVSGTNTNTSVSYTETTTTTTTSGGAVIHEEPVIYVPGYTGAVGCPMPMSPPDFQAAKGSIMSKTFEDSKLTIAKQITNSNCLLASQVREIMMLFDFEDTKLEFAKYAYHKTYDVGNFYQVNDAFEFEMTIDELNNYVMQSPK